MVKLAQGSAAGLSGASPTTRRLRSPSRRRSVEGAQVLVDERDCHRALADRGGHAFDGAVADVTRDEQAGLAGLEEERGAGERPRRLLPVAEQIRSCDEKSVFVAAQPSLHS